VVLDWFKEWVGYPREAAGLLLSGGSVANLTGLACARAGLAGDDLSRAVVYFSAESHSSVAKAARVLGFPPERVRALPADPLGRLEAGPLVAALELDRATGLLPLAIVASAGTTSTGAVDPLSELAELAAAQKLWLHVDAAYGGFAVLTERGRALLRGMERADSITLDPHKWLYQPFEVGCLLVREGARLERAFHVMPHYLQDTAVSGREVNFGERGIQLTRSARVLKIWLSLQYFGVAAFVQAIDRCIDLALYAQERLEKSRRFELLAPASLGIVCFRRVWSGVQENVVEGRNVQLTKEFAASGVGLISSTRAQGRYALRLCILNHRTTRSDVDRVIDWLETWESA
jgi:glutamate/tyrosine decarboxylase-like PLP-dependent enzyme